MISSVQRLRPGGWHSSKGGMHLRRTIASVAAAALVWTVCISLHADACTPGNGDSSRTSALSSNDLNLGKSNEVIRWRDGGPGCDSYFVEGAHYKSIATDDLYVAAAVQDTGWKMRADIYVRNKGRARLDVLPETVSMSVVLPDSEELDYQDPHKLAKSLEKRAKWASFFGQMAASLQTQQVTSNTSGSASGYARDGNGNWVTGSASGVATTQTSIPDYAAQQRALQQSARNMRSAQDAAAYLNAVALKANTLAPWGDAYGAVFFKRAKNTEVVLRMKLGAITYEIPFVRPTK
jgi:hypothetical protein